MPKKYITQLLFKILLLLWICGLSVNTLHAKPPQGFGSERKAEKRSMHIFSNHDKNQDGLLSRDEYAKFVEHMKQHKKKSGRIRPGLLCFDKIDSDMDNQLSEGELINALNKRLKEHRRYRYRQGN